MKALPAGDLDRRLTILAPTASSGLGGETIESGWSTVATVWAGKRPIAAKELERPGVRQGQAEVRFTIRWRAGVGVAHRVSCEGVTYALTGIEEIGRREGLILWARAAV